MEEIGLGEEDSEDVEKFNKIIRPFRGEKASNPLNLCFLSEAEVDGDVYYWLSRTAFDATERILRKRVVEFLDGELGGDRKESPVMEQLLYLCYGNASQTARHKPRARNIVSCLVEEGEMSKKELMRTCGLNPGSESDDRKFRRTMQYLKGSWDTERKNPLHTENHGFVVSTTMEGSTSYYQVSPGEFRRAMNVVVKNLRGFLDTELAKVILGLREHTKRGV
ncbi:hypothetical protein ACM16X_02695 [Haloarcula japonica]|uniref:hypothetical protein n=1 Tax=Haloarcula japonica TaxID=29282 RepID=UPI0039F6887D